jgi:hypothetical protein
MTGRCRVEPTPDKADEDEDWKASCPCMIAGRECDTYFCRCCDDETGACHNQNLLNADEKTVRARSRPPSVCAMSVSRTAADRGGREPRLLWLRSFPRRRARSAERRLCGRVHWPSIPSRRVR